MIDAVFEVIGSFLQSEEFRENLKKIGPDSKFWYRSRLDPLTEEEYRALCRRDREEWQGERAEEA